jgi:prevent-host-death family protein
MNEIVITIEDAARCLSELVERVYASGEAVVIVKSGKPIARIVPIPSREHVQEDLIAFLRRWRNEHPEPDEQLAEVIQESRRAVQPPRDPWG